MYDNALEYLKAIAPFVCVNPHCYGAGYNRGFNIVAYGGEGRAISLIFKLSICCRQVSWSLQFQETYSRKIYLDYEIFICLGAIILYLLEITCPILSHIQAQFQHF